MLRKLWTAYSDFVTLDWLLRPMANEPARVIGVLLTAGALFVLCQFNLK